MAKVHTYLVASNQKTETMAPGAPGGLSILFPPDGLTQASKPSPNGDPQETSNILSTEPKQAPAKTLHQLYPPLLPNNHLGIPATSNKANFPLVLLQPKLRSTRTTVGNHASPQLSNRTVTKVTPIAGRGHDRTSTQKPSTSLTPNASHMEVDAEPNPTLHTSDKSNKDNFILVPYKTKHSLLPNNPDIKVSGVRLRRFGSKTELATYPSKFGQLLEALLSVNLQILIFPYTCEVERIYKASELLKTPQDYKALMDITLVNWGSPSDGKGKLAMSFYIGSSVFAEGLEMLKQSSQFKKFLSESKFSHFHCYLHQTESTPLAFSPVNP